MNTSSGIVFNIMRFSIHDGPGIRTTVFLKGCPLSCWWCHNPEGQWPDPELIFRESRCIKCGGCVEACPTDAIRGVGTCLKCGSCTRACNSGALEMIGASMTVPQVMAEVEKDIIFYDESGGGVTFGGGEPIMQPDFLEGLLIACKKQELHTAVDTTGHVDPKVMLRIAEYTDLFLYDLKSMDDEKHRKYTGVPNGLILENIKMLSDLGKHIVVRFPMIPGINDDDDNIKAMAEFLAPLGVDGVEVLSYHKTGSDKYAGLRKPYYMPETAPPSQERVAEVKAVIAGAGIKIAGVGL